MAEGLLRHLSSQTQVFSAGREPSSVHPLAIEAMRAEGIDITTHRSKHLDEFVAQRFDCVITVCDSASKSCPVFPGAPERIHWSVPDPSAVEGSDDQRYRAFRDCLIDLRTRIQQFLNR